MARARPARDEGQLPRAARSALLGACVALMAGACGGDLEPPALADQPVPVTAVDVAAGRPLYAQQCASCHGEGGAGDGPDAGAGTAAPKSFAEPDLVADLSPSVAYRAITDGLPDTDMHAFEALSSVDRWTLAYFVVAMRHDEGVDDHGLELAERAGLEIDPASLAMLSERDVREALAALSQAERRRAHAAMRWLAPHRDGGPLADARRHLAMASRYYREGRRREARESLARGRASGIMPLAAVSRLAAPELEARLSGEMTEMRTAMAAGATSLEIERRAAGAAATTREIEDALAIPESGAMIGARAAAVTIGSTVDGFVLLLMLLAAAHLSGRRRERRWICASALLALIAGIALGRPGSLGGSLVATIEGVVSVATAIALIAATPVAIRRILQPGRRALVTPSFTAFLSGGAAVALFRDAASATPSLAHLAADSAAAVTLGACGAVVILAILVIGVGAMSARLPPMYSAIGFALGAAVTLILSTGNGIHALQLIGAAPETAIGGARADWLALFPTKETLLSQALAPAIFAVVLAYSGSKVLSGSRYRSSSQLPRSKS